MAIDTLDKLIASFPGQKIAVNKHNVGGTVGVWATMRPGVGHPGPGVTPSSGLSGAVVTKASPGAPPFDNPPAGQNSYLGSLFVYPSAVKGVVAIFDRVWENSGLSPTSTAPQTINSVALNRPDALGTDIEPWLEIYATMGAGTPTITISYTNQDGVAGRTGTLMNLVSAAASGRTFPFQLQGSDTGVRSIQSYTQSATMTSGTHGLVLRRRLASIPFYFSGIPSSMDVLTVGLPQVYDDSYLEFMFTPEQTTSSNFFITTTILQG